RSTASTGRTSPRSRRRRRRSRSTRRPHRGSGRSCSGARCRVRTGRGRRRTKPPPIKAAGAKPIVVVGTTRDPATPYAWAVGLAHQLESGVLITRDGDGHTGYKAGNECVDNVVETYLLQGTAPTADIKC